MRVLIACEEAKPPAMLSEISVTKRIAVIYRNALAVTLSGILWAMFCP